MNIRTMKRLIILLMLIIFPLTDALAQPSGGKHVVAIDAAHGGSDLGVKHIR